MNCRIIHTLFFFITVLSLPAFFCTKLPTDPAEDPNNSGITLFIKEKNTTAQRTVPRRVGLSIHFNTHLETYHIYSKCSNLDSTFEFHSDNITDTLFFYPTFKTEGQCTLFVDAIFHDKNLDSLSDFFTFQVLPAPPTLLFDNVPDNYITLLNQPDTFEIQIVTKDASEYDLETYASTKPPLDTSRLKLIHSSTPEFYNVVINPDTTDTFSLTLYARIKDKNDDILYLDSTIFMIDVLESLTLFKDISDTILSGKENTEISINLNDYLILSDQEITFTPSFGTITDDTLFTFLPEWGCNPQYTLFIIATNEIGNDTMKLHLNIHPADSTSPQIRLSDSTLTDKTISQSAIAISVITTDDLSGISTVHFITSTDTFESTLSSDSMYTADIIDLPKHVTLPITILATDNSIKSNTSELNIHITYDPTSDDTIKPEINQVSGPSNNSRLTHSSDTLSFSITDSSGIDSIWWTLNHTFVDNISILSTGNYQILFSLSEFDTT